jgi:DNA-binding transcriptional ArsR family regulator
VTPEKNHQGLDIEVAVLQNAASVLRAINHKLRMRIIVLIHTKQKMIVSDIYKQLRLEQSVASQQLSILRSGGFVKTERSGKFIFYSIDYDKLNRTKELSSQI